MSHYLRRKNTWCIYLIW